MDILIGLPLSFLVLVSLACLWRHHKRSKPPELVKGFTALPQCTLELWGWKAGLSPRTQARLLARSVGPHDHLWLQQERERFYEAMRRVQ